MALIKCHECGSDVSTEAIACPKCGAPVKAPATETSAPKSEFTRPMKPWEVIVALVGAAAIIWWFSSPSKSNGSPDAKPTAEECKADDLQCLGDKGVISAGLYCQKPIEMLAQHSVKWTDGTFDMKFSQFRWHDKGKGEITYIGNKAEFQNGFGAFNPVIYECDLASDSKTVMDARVQEGRLP